MSENNDSDNLEGRGDEGGNQSQVAQPQSLVLSPEALRAIISSAVNAALANLNLNGAQQQSAPTPAFEHYSSSCTREKRTKGTCFKCNDPGHQLRDCPEKKSTNFAAGTTKHLSTVEVKICDHEFSALIDSGCTANIVREVVPRLLNIEVERNNEVYTGLGSGSIRSCGRFQVTVSIRDEFYDIPFSVVPYSAIPHDVIIGEPFFTMATVSFGPNGTQIKMVVELEPEVKGEILNITLEPQQSCVPQVNTGLKAEDHNQLDQLLQKYKEKLQHPEPTVKAEARITLSEEKEIIHQPRRRWADNGIALNYLGRLGADNSCRNVQQNREKLADYFISDNGSVTWQWQHVRRGRVTI
ncbi:hypothetical protein CBL_02906 [Carabus blaptoides fortunei]